MAEAALKTEQSEFQEESVSAGRFFGATETLSSENIDRHNLRFDSDEARRIKTDAEVQAAVEFVIDAILTEDIETVGAGVEDYAVFDLAEEISEFVRRSMLESCKFFAGTLQKYVIDSVSSKNN